MMIDANIARVFKQAKDEIVREFGLPSWMKAKCGTCMTEMEQTDMLEFGVCLTPQFIGDVSCSFMCPNCNSLWEKHFQLNVISRKKLAEALVDDDLSCEPMDKQALLQQGSHNVSDGRTGRGMIKIGTINGGIKKL